MYTLNDTVALMNSSDYKERFIAEYLQTKLRYDKLHTMLNNYDAGKLDFEPSCPIDVLKEQKKYMGMYLNKLEIRALIENIDLNTNCICPDAKEQKPEPIDINEANTPDPDDIADKQKIIRRMMEVFYNGMTVQDTHGEKACIDTLTYDIPDNRMYNISMTIIWNKTDAKSYINSEDNFDLMYEFYQNKLKTFN